jgi:hypothetical protein
MRRQQIGTAGGSPLRSLCSRLTEAIESRLPHDKNYQAGHILRIKKDVSAPSMNASTVSVCGSMI